MHEVLYSIAAANMPANLHIVIEAFSISPCDLTTWSSGVVTNAILRSSASIVEWQALLLVADILVIFLLHCLFY
jgi:hypothetical protein